jgi:hypothetical protein
MKCYYHPDVEAVATCSNCGKGVCQICSVDVAGRIVCSKCLSSGNFPRYQPPPLQPSKPYNILAIVSIILGILGICSGFLAIPAWITGHYALKQISENPNQEGKSLAEAGRLLGIIITVIYSIALFCYIGSIMIGGFSHAF